MKAEDNRRDDGKIAVEQFPRRAVQEINGTQHRENGRNSEHDLARSRHPAPYPKDAEVHRNVGPSLPSENL